MLMLSSERDTEKKMASAIQRSFNPFRPKKIKNWIMSSSNKLPDDSEISVFIFSSFSVTGSGLRVTGKRRESLNSRHLIHTLRKL